MTAAARVVLLVTSPRVAPGLLSADAWDALRAGPVYVADADLPVVEVMRSAGVAVQIAGTDRRVSDVAVEVVDAAHREGTATWWLGPDRDEDMVRAVTLVIDGRRPQESVDIEIMDGSWDVPGARLLDVVATMDRLRSPGGCPWDVAQDHASLAPYLLEEAYEAFQAIEDADLRALRDELGDVLLQIAFHARLAEELPADERWSIDDVATGLVDKLVRRHPHVFDGLDVRDADEVNANWDAIKAAERGGGSPLAHVPLASPALTLAATLQRKAARAGASDIGAQSLAAAASDFYSAPTAETAGELLWAAVAAIRDADVDAEAALRARARQFRDDYLDRPNG